MTAIGTSAFQTLGLFEQTQTKLCMNLSQARSSFLTANIKGGRKLQMLKWIYEKDPTSTHESIKERRTPGTLGWFFSSPEFENWIDGASDTLICYGIRTCLRYDLC